MGKNHRDFLGSLAGAGKRARSAFFSAFKGSSVRTRGSRGIRRFFNMASPLVVIVSLFTPFFAANATTCTTSGNNVTISANCQFDAGTYTFTGTLTINSGVTVTAASNVGNAQVI